MRKKRFLATILAASMVMGNVVVASAASQTDTYTEQDIEVTGKPIATQTGKVTGSGSMGDTVQDRIFRVVVPAQRVSTEPDLFDFIMDPQGLIDATNAAKYVSGASIGGKTLSVNSHTKKGSTLYFVNSSNGVKTLSDTSDELVIINKGTLDVDISVNAQATGTGITVSADKEFTGYKQPAVYLGFIPNGGTAKAISSGNAEVDTATIGNAKEFYEVSYNAANGKTEYKILSVNSKTGKSESENAYKTYKFKLTGATNKNADWVNPQVNGTVKVDIVYNMSEHVDNGPSFEQSEYTLTAGRGLAVNVNPGSATDIESITFNNGTSTLPTTNYSYDATNKQLIFKRELTDALTSATGFTSRTYTVTFNDSAKTKVNITLKK